METHGHVTVDPRVHRTEMLISNLLRLGVLLSVTLVIIGTAVTLARHHEYFTSASALEPLRSGDIQFPVTIGGIISGVAHLEGRAIVALGLLALVLTPIMRVGISIAIFAFTGDRTFAGITAVVLGLLLLSLLLGKAGG